MTTTISLQQHRLATAIAAHIATCCRDGETGQLRIARLARHFALSPTALKQVFKIRYHQPIHAYIIKVRMQHICHQLTQTGHSLKEVAYCSGYTEYSNFCRDVTKYTGRSPKAWRLQLENSGRREQFAWPRLLRSGPYKGIILYREAPH